MVQNSKEKGSGTANISRIMKRFIRCARLLVFRIQLLQRNVVLAKPNWVLTC